MNDSLCSTFNHENNPFGHIYGIAGPNEYNKAEPGLFAN